MTVAQIQQYQVDIQPILAKLQNDIASHQPPVAPSWQDIIRGTAVASSGPPVSSVASATYHFVNSGGDVMSVQPLVITGAQLSAATEAQSVGADFVGLPPHPCQPPEICPRPGLPGLFHPDSDNDGLPDQLESEVADEFTPFYGSSAGEQQQFATFGNYVPMTVTSLVGTVPPFSYYRVEPLGLDTDSDGNQVFAFRIDYLTLWNADGGLIGGGAPCYYSYVGLDGVINELSGHDLDVERSVMLVAAPAEGSSFNQDPSTYSIYAIYTAAHEGTFFDQSTYIILPSPVASGNHIELALSLSKHSTYSFDPDYYPITPQWFIADYNAAFLALWQTGVITNDEYYLSIVLGNDTFYGCVVERFSNQGGNYANQRVNVGEPNYPINGSGFIQDDSARALHIKDKLTNPVF